MNRTFRPVRSRALILLTGLALGTLVAATGAATASGAIAPPPAGNHPQTVVRNTCARSSLDVPSCGVLWGLFTKSQNYAPIESQVGRQFDLVKNYVGWQAGGTFPDAADKALVANGQRTLYISWNAVNYSTNARISYQAVANGTYDKTVIIPEAKALIAFKQKIFLDFSHEFDNKTQAQNGTPAQFAAAYQHIHQVFAAQGVTNVIWVWVSTGFMGHTSQIAAGYPGSSYVNWIGYDPYNFYTCHNGHWYSPTQVFAPFYNWLQTQSGMKGKPVLLSEYGSLAGSGVQAWYAGVAPALQALPLLKAAIMYDAEPSAACDWLLSQSPVAMKGFITSGLSPYVTGT